MTTIQGLDDEVINTSLTIYHEDSKESYTISKDQASLSSLIGATFFGVNFEVPKTYETLINTNYVPVVDTATFRPVTFLSYAYEVKGRNLVRRCEQLTVNAIEQFTNIFQLLTSYRNPKDIMRKHTLEIPYDPKESFLPNEISFFTGLFSHQERLLTPEEKVFASLSSYHKTSLLLIKVSPFMRTLEYYGFDCLLTHIREWCFNLAYQSLDKLDKKMKDHVAETFIAHQKNILTINRNTVSYRKLKKRGITVPDEELYGLFDRQVKAKACALDEQGVTDAYKKAREEEETATYIIPGWVQLNKTNQECKRKIEDQVQLLNTIINEEPIKCNYYNLVLSL